ncbi:SA1362 family protein [Oceanobacillus massiliensis]|uniref:SA1362 family protein n=1 Tax=Oceanobacillus massiliensis TaxID=1465765 RepID=UPI0002893441|nr:SA1362 family protein [Oceanobacillus massiliensis]
MGGNKFSIIIYLVIGLAVIGLISQLIGNTVNFLTNILLMLAAGAAIYGLLYYFLLRKRAPSNSDDMKKYKKAVRQSKSKYKQPVNSTAAGSKPTITAKKKRNKRSSHLRVIEGNKPKGKDRASF